MDLLEKYEARLKQLEKGSKELYEGEKDLIIGVIDAMHLDMIADCLEEV